VPVCLKIPWDARSDLPIQVQVGMGHPEPGMSIANSAQFLLEIFLKIHSLNRL
jgi:hypothetical protein